MSDRLFQLADRDGAKHVELRLRDIVDAAQKRVAKAETTLEDRISERDAAASTLAEFLMLMSPTVPPAPASNLEVAIAELAEDQVAQDASGSASSDEGPKEEPAETAERTCGNMLCCVRSAPNLCKLDPSATPDHTTCRGYTEPTPEADGFRITEADIENALMRSGTTGYAERVLAAKSITADFLKREHGEGASSGPGGPTIARSTSKGLRITAGTAEKKLTWAQCVPIVQKLKDEGRFGACEKPTDNIDAEVTPDDDCPDCKGDGRPFAADGSRNGNAKCKACCGTGKKLATFDPAIHVRVDTLDNQYGTPLIPAMVRTTELRGLLDSLTGETVFAVTKAYADEAGFKDKDAPAPEYDWATPNIAADFEIQDAERMVLALGEDTEAHPQVHWFGEVLYEASYRDPDPSAKDHAILFTVHVARPIGMAVHDAKVFAKRYCEEFGVKYQGESIKERTLTLLFEDPDTPLTEDAPPHVLEAISPTPPADVDFTSDDITKGWKTELAQTARQLRAGDTTKFHWGGIELYVARISQPGDALRLIADARRTDELAAKDFAALIAQLGYDDAGDFSQSGPIPMDGTEAYIFEITSEEAQ